MYLVSCLLAAHGRARQGIDQTVGVGRNEIDRTIEKPKLGHGKLHRRPPLPGRAVVAEIARAEHADIPAFPGLGETEQVRPELLAPDAAQTVPISLGDQQQFAYSLHQRRVFRLAGGETLDERGRFRRGAQDAVDFGQLDLQGDDGRNHVVQIGRRRDQRAQGFLAVVVPFAAAGRRGLQVQRWRNRHIPRARKQWRSDRARNGESASPSPGAAAANTSSRSCRVAVRWRPAWREGAAVICAGSKLETLTAPELSSRVV